MYPLLDKWYKQYSGMLQRVKGLKLDAERAARRGDGMTYRIYSPPEYKRGHLAV